MWTGLPLVPSGAGTFYAHVARLNAADADRRPAAHADSVARDRDAASTAGCSSLRPNDATPYDERRPRFVTCDGQSDTFELNDESRAARTQRFPGRLRSQRGSPKRDRGRLNGAKLRRSLFADQSLLSCCRGLLNQSNTLVRLLCARGSNRFGRSGTSASFLGVEPDPARQSQRSVPSNRDAFRRFARGIHSFDSAFPLPSFR
jgi:hypothetical protein